MLSFQSFSKADDIKELQIEGVSISENALDYFSKEKLDADKGYYPKSKKIWRSLIKLKDKEYDSLQLHIKSQNNKYMIVGVAGLIYFPNKKNSLERCKKKKNQIVKDLKNILKNTKLSNEEKDKVQGDKSGKSYVLGSYFDFKVDKSEYVKVACTFYTKEYSKETGWSDYLRISLTSTEFNKFLNNEAYK